MLTGFFLSARQSTAVFSMSRALLSQAGPMALARSAATTSARPTRFALVSASRACTSVARLCYCLGHAQNYWDINHICTTMAFFREQTPSGAGSGCRHQAGRAHQRPSRYCPLLPAQHFVPATLDCMAAIVQVSCITGEVRVRECCRNTIYAALQPVPHLPKRSARLAVMAPLMSVRGRRSCGSSAAASASAASAALAPFTFLAAPAPAGPLPRAFRVGTTCTACHFLLPFSHVFSLQDMQQFA